MKSRYLLDTNILSEVLKPNPSKSIVENINLKNEELSTASIVLHEIAFGCWRLPENSKQRLNIQQYIPYSTYITYNAYKFTFDRLNHQDKPSKRESASSLDAANPSTSRIF